MTIRRRLLAVLFGVLATSTLAVAGSLSGASFQAYTLSDAPYITHSNSGVYNSDTTNPRYASAPLGVVGINTNNSSFYGTNTYLYHNNSTTYCWVIYTNVTNASAQVIGSGAISTVGYGSMSIGVTIPAGNAGTTWAGNLICRLPQSTGTTWTTIFGEWPTNGS
jgi:hypothetical protein